MAPQRKNGNGGNNGKGGGAPAGGNGGNDGGDDGGDDDDGDEQPLTRTEVMKLINGAVSGQLSRKLGPAIEAGMAPVLAKLDELKVKPADDDDDEEADPDGDEGAGNPPVGKKNKNGKPDPLVAKLQRELERQRRQLDEAQQKSAKEAEARKNAAIESALTSALTELGVDKHRMRGALAVHKPSAFVDDAGTVLFKVKRDGYDEDLEPGAFLKEWGSTDEGKSYLAPTGSTGGAGARAPKTPGASRKPAANSPEAKAQKIQDAKTSLLTAVAGELAGGVVSVE